MITGRGLAAMLAAIALLIAQLVSGRKPFLTMSLALILLLAVSLTRLILDRRKVDVRLRLDPDVVQRGELKAVQVLIRNAGPDYLGPVDLQLAVDNLPVSGSDKPVRRIGQEWRRLMLAGNVEGHVSVDLDTEHRGFYRISLERIRCRDNLGFFRLRLLPRHKAAGMVRNLTVLPKAWPFVAEQELRSSLEQELKRHNWRIGPELDDLAGVHSHRPGEALKRAHWKLTARLRELMIKDYENPEQREAVMVLDLACPMRSPQNWVDFADCFADCADYLASRISDAGGMVRLIAHSGRQRHEVVAHSPVEMDAVRLFLAGLSDDGAFLPEEIIDHQTQTRKSTQLMIWMSNRLNRTTAERLLNSQQLGQKTWFVLIDYDPDLKPDEATLVARLKEAGCPVLVASFAAWRK